MSSSFGFPSSWTIQSRPISSPLGGMTQTVRYSEARDPYDVDVSRLQGPNAMNSRPRFSIYDDKAPFSPTATVRDETVSGGGPNYFSTVCYKSPYGKRVRMASCPGMSQYLPK